LRFGICSVYKDTGFHSPPALLFRIPIWSKSRIPSPVSLALLRQHLSEIIAGTPPGTPGLTTGLDALDSALPNHGLPRGRLTELVGLPGSGKTTLVRRIAERTVHDGGSVAYIDATRTLAPRDWAHVGANANQDGLWVVRPDTPTRGAWCADVLLRSGAFSLVVLDGAPMLSRAVAVRLTRLAREADAALLVLGDDAKASELAGSLRLRATRRRTSVTVVIEKGAPYQTVQVFSLGDVDRDIEVARRVRTHSEVPDRRGVARTQRVSSAGDPAGAALGHAADRAGGGEAAGAAGGDVGRGTLARPRGDVGARGKVTMRRARSARVG
jgi:energy-coupling factor transporter ATP-binding protein EcfA2